jgi:hypothetical protein
MFRFTGQEEIRFYTTSSSNEVGSRIQGTSTKKRKKRKKKKKREKTETTTRVINLRGAK